MYEIVAQAESIEEMRDIVNQIREKANRPAVEIRDDLTCAAKTWSEYQARLRICTNNGPAGQKFPERVRRCGGESVGGYEMVACNVPSVDYAITIWINDPENAAFFLAPKPRYIGIGHAGWDGTYQGWYVLLIESPKEVSNEVDSYRASFKLFNGKTRKRKGRMDSGPTDP